jgi:hypothetical protein
MSQDYNSLKEFIAKGKNKESRKIDNNTVIRLDNDNIIVKYHDTDICVISPDDTRTYYTNGFYTFTTKDRINNFMVKSFRLYQKNHIWYVWNYDTKQEYLFDDGLTISAKGEISGYKTSCKRDNVKIKQVNNYVKAYIDKLVKGKIDKPGAGDCFYCQFHTQDNKSMGEVSDNQDHILSHMQEKYYVPSLLYNAVNKYPVSQMAMWYLSSVWGYSDTEFPQNMLDLVITQITKSLKKYILESQSLVR